MRCMYHCTYHCTYRRTMAHWTLYIEMCNSYNVLYWPKSSYSFGYSLALAGAFKLIDQDDRLGINCPEYCLCTRLADSLDCLRVETVRILSIHVVDTCCWYIDGVSWILYHGCCVIDAVPWIVSCIVWCDWRASGEKKTQRESANYIENHIGST